MSEIQGELKHVLLARAWLKKILDDKRSFLDKVFLRFFIFLFGMIEDIISKPLYVKKNQSLGISLDTLNMIRKAKNLGFLKDLSLLQTLPDEPKIFMAYASCGDLLLESSKNNGTYRKWKGFGGADFFYKEKAVLRCLGEAVERTCLGYYREKDIVCASYKELESSAVNPREFVSFSKNQISDQAFKNCVFDENTKFGWVLGKSLINEKKLFVPAQLVYLSYRFRQNEPIIRRTNSTGAAAYTNRDEAIYRGICEAVERDAVMIYYLNKISPPIIDLASSEDEELIMVDKRFRRKNLELYVLDLKTDIDIPVFGTLLIDRAGGPAVAFASKSDFDSKKAVLGSIDEAVRIWCGKRRKMTENPDFSSIEARAHEIYDLTERGLLWAQAKMIKHIEFLTYGKKKSFELTNSTGTSSKRLNLALNYFRKNKIEVVSVDITAPAASKLGFFAFMTIIPKLQPLYLDERYRCWGGERLYNVPVKLGYLKEPNKEEELNQITHPYV